MRLEEAFERIEETILPCIAMMLDTLIDASESVEGDERRFLAAELKTLAAELEELTQDCRTLQPGPSCRARRVSRPATSLKRR